MGRTNIAFLQNPVTGPAGNKCAPVLLDTPAGDVFLPETVTMTTTQTGGHIFYRITNTNTNVFNPPVHNGDNAVTPTVRIGSNSGSVFVGNTGSTFRIVAAVCYQAGFLDSDITSIQLERPEPGGGGGGGGP